MWLEVQRLYLDYRKVNGKYKIVLDAMSDEYGAKNDFNLF